MEFRNKVAVITGGASGIGRSVALEFARLGADVAIADIDEARMTQTLQEIKAIGHRALGVPCDVSRDADVENLAEQVISQMGKADILMNNAGTGIYGNIERMKIADYKLILDINVLGVIRGVLAFLPHMLERGSGYIINTASAAGLWGLHEPYPVSKYTIVGYSEGLYGYLRPKGIMVSVLCPGITNTNLIYNSPIRGNEQEVSEARALLEKTFTAPDALEPDNIALELVQAMKKNRFLVLTSGTERYITNAINRGRDVQKLEKYLQETYK